jgi:hypothetical protein
MVDVCGYPDGYEPPVRKILNDREKTYGDYQRTSHISQSLKGLLRLTPSWVGLSFDKKESLDLLCTKLARILNGDPNYRDSWVDCIGYLQLVIDNLPASSPAP